MSRTHPEALRRGDNHPARLNPERLQGENNGRAKVSRSQVDQIRSLYAKGNISQAKLSEMFGIHQTNISRIIIYKGWK